MVDIDVLFLSYLLKQSGIMTFSLFFIKVITKLNYNLAYGGMN